MSSYGLGPRRPDAWYVDTVAEAQALLRAAENGDPEALKAVALAGRALGEAATTAICAVLDPELIVLGGPVGTNALLLREVQQALDDLTPAPTPAAMTALGPSAPLQGALELALQHARENI